MIKEGLSTKELAARLGITPHTIRTALSRDKSYFGLEPTKMRNRFLLWPADSVERLSGKASGGGNTK